MRKWRLQKILFLSSAIITFGILSLYIFFEHRVGNLSKHLIDRERFATTVPKIREDLDKLMSIAPLQHALSSMRISDPVLNAGQQIDIALQKDITEINSASFKPFLFGLQNENWFRHPLAPFAFQFRGQIFETSINYRFWSSSKGPGTGEERLPTDQIRFLVRLHLRSGDYLPYRQKDHVREVYHLAILALSSQHMPIVLAGLDWLDDLRHYYAESFSPNMVHFYNQDQKLSQFSKALWATAAFLDWTIDDQLFSSLFAQHQQDDLVLCTALNERLPTLAMERQFLKSENKTAFESFEIRVQKLKSKCRFSPELALWEEKTHPSKPTMMTKFSSLVLGTIKRPDYLEAY